MTHKILILGGDGYLGWPTAMNLAIHGYEITIVDNYLKRKIANEIQRDSLTHSPLLNERVSVFKSSTGKIIDVIEGDCADYQAVLEIMRTVKPDSVVHYAEQASAPYSMIGVNEANLTLNNNLNTTFNILWAIIQTNPDCHLIKLGTMGEYGTPNIDIEDGWIEIEKNGRKDKFIFPREAGSLYHTTKILDTDLMWFYVRNSRLKVTDLMQGPVYGIHTDETRLDERLLPSFYYDDVFGTVLNRFIVQAVTGAPLTVYGKGGQTRGFLNIIDTLQCVRLAVEQPATPGELRILNQFTEEFSVLDLAGKVAKAGDQFGLSVKIDHIENPRNELEEHYYNASNEALISLGLTPNYLTEAVIISMMKTVSGLKANISTKHIRPEVNWN